MIFFDHSIRELASFDWEDTVSQRTGQEFSYTYYLELVKKSRNYTLSNDEYYDLEISRYKFDLNAAR